MKTYCRRCGGTSQARDGSCNEIVGYRRDTQIPLFCMSMERSKVKLGPQVTPIPGISFKNG